VEDIVDVVGFTEPPVVVAEATVEIWEEKFTRKVVRTARMFLVVEEAIEGAASVEVVVVVTLGVSPTMKVAGKMPEKVDIRRDIAAVVVVADPSHVVVEAVAPTNRRVTKVRLPERPLKAIRETGSKRLPVLIQYLLFFHHPKINCF